MIINYFVISVMVIVKECVPKLALKLLFSDEFIV